MKSGIFIGILLLFLTKSSVLAQSPFITDIKTQYVVREEGLTTVVTTHTIENATSELQSASYVMNLKNISPQNLTITEDGLPLTFKEEKKDDNLKVTINFDKPVAGIGKTRTFIVNYEDENLAVRTGEVWEVAIPKVENINTFSKYEVELSVPDSFGEAAYIAPEPNDKEIFSERIIYKFTKEKVAKRGITAGFGKFQVFAFTLKYHLENPLNAKSSTEIAIPPDTSTQKMFYHSLDPTPSDVRLDKDGNWLATYDLEPRQRLDIEAKGSVQILPTPKRALNVTPSTLLENTMATQYWQVDDQEIKDLAYELKTPEAIYNYVSQKLKYNYDRVKPNVERLGAKKALEEPSNAICTEFTDLFIALSRAAGIPAREINGFAYTENPEIQPLSLVSDVLHAWPEYWDDSKRTWVPVDPTWGATTGGVDFFNKFDLRHFAFTIHGVKDTLPYPPGSYKLGPNPQKDVFVSFSQMPLESSKELTLSQSTKGMGLFSKKLVFTLENKGETAFYDINPKVFFDEREVSDHSIEVIPPYGKTEIEVAVPLGFLGHATPHQVVLVAEDRVLPFKTNKERLTVLQLLLILTTLVIATLTFIFKMGRRKHG